MTALGKARLRSFMHKRAVTALIALSLASALVVARPRVAAQQQQPTSYELIARALAAGQIDEETAHKYRVFAAFGDGRLPAQFTGNDSALTEPPSVVLEAGTRLHTFSAQVQAELRPYFTAPGMPGSWVELSADTADAPPDEAAAVDAAAAAPFASPEMSDRAAPRSRRTRAIHWHTVLAANGAVKVWAQPRHAGDSAKAEALAREITNTIWPALVPVLGRPKSDANTPNSSGGPELDIFLVRPNAATQQRLAQRPGIWAGLAMYADPQVCQDAAFFLLLNGRRPLGSATSSGLLQDAAHEIAHALTGAKPLLNGDCSEYDWMEEATATWAEHKAYPDAQSEHAWASGFLDELHVTLDQSTPGADFNLRAYQSYLFPLYLQLTNQEAAISAIWNEFRRRTLRYGIAKGLEAAGAKPMELFPQFALRNLNEESVDEYTTKDRMRHKPAIADSMDVSIPAGRDEWERAITMNIVDLAAHNAKFTFDGTVRSVAFENTLVPVDHARVWAVPYINGHWGPPLNLSQQHQKLWCRDHPLEDISALVLVFTNVSWEDVTKEVQPQPGFEPMLRAYPTACGPGWTGTTSQLMTSTAQDVVVREHVTSTIRFEVDSSLITSGLPPEHWKSVGGHLSWRITVTGKCTGGKSGGTPIVPDSVEHFATLSLWRDNAGRRHHSATGHWLDADPIYSVQCPEGPSQLAAPTIGAFFTSDVQNDSIATDGKSFGGNYTRQLAPGITVTTTYSFRCSRRC